MAARSPSSVSGSMNGAAHGVDAQAGFLRLPLQLLHVILEELERSKLQGLEPRMLETLVALSERLREVSKQCAQGCPIPDEPSLLLTDISPDSRHGTTERSVNETLDLGKVAPKSVAARSDSALAGITQGLEAGTLESQAPEDLTTWRVRRLCARRASQLFDALDTNKSETIAFAELQVTLRNAGMSESAIAALAQKADASHDGMIDRIEFLRAASEPGTIDMVTDEHIARIEEKQPWCMLRQASLARVCWDLMFSVILMYMAVSEPLFLAFPESRGSTLWIRISLAIDCLFCFDIALNFRTGFYDEDGSEILDPSKVATTYCRSWLLLDLISSLPIGVMMSTQLVHLRLLRLLKFGTIRRRLINFVKSSSVFEGAMSSDVAIDLYDSVQKSAAFRLLPIILVLWSTLLCCHWLACLMIYSGQGFLDEYQDVEQRRDVYVAAYYWAVTTVSTVGYGDIVPGSTPERLYTIFAMIMGGAFYGYILAKMTSILTVTETASQVYQSRMNDVSDWLLFHQFPCDLRRRTHKYFAKYFAQEPGVDTVAMLNCLSPGLHKEISEYLLAIEVRNLPAFANIPSGAMSQLVKLLRRTIVQAEEYIVQAGDLGYGLYVIISGAVRMEFADVDTQHAYECSSISLQPMRYHLSEQSSENARSGLLEAGDSFGHEMLLSRGGVYRYTAIAQKSVTMQLLPVDAFMAEFNGFPSVLRQVRLNVASMQTMPSQRSAKKTQGSQQTSPVLPEFRDDPPEEARPLLRSSGRRVKRTGYTSL